VFDVKGAIPVDTKGEGLILDDDPEPSLSISDDTDAPEGSKALVTVTLTEKSEKVVKVDWRTVGGGSAGGATNADFTADSGTLTFLPGETTKQVEVSIVANDGAEAAAETFYVRIENASNASISDPMGSVTIPPSTT
jgi:hypothetical protein